MYRCRACPYQIAISPFRCAPEPNKPGNAHYFAPRGVLHLPGSSDPSAPVLWLESRTWPPFFFPMTLVLTCAIASSSVTLRPNILPTNSMRGSEVTSYVPTSLPLRKHGDPVGDAIYLVQKMCNKNNADAFAFSFRITSKSKSLSLTSRLEVGSSRIRILALAICKRTRNRYHLLNRQRIIFQRLGDINLYIQTFSAPAPPADSSCPINAAKTMRLASKHNIFGDRNVGAEVDFLIYRADAQFLRMQRRSHLNGFALQFNRCRCRDVPLLSVL